MIARVIRHRVSYTNRLLNTDPTGERGGGGRAEEGGSDRGGSVCVGGGGYLGPKLVREKP